MYRFCDCYNTLLIPKDVIDVWHPVLFQRDWFVVVGMVVVVRKTETSWVPELYGCVSRAGQRCAAMLLSHPPVSAGQLLATYAGAMFLIVVSLNLLLTRNPYFW